MRRHRPFTPATKKVWTVDDIKALGVVTDIVTAGSIIGVGRTTTYRMAREEQFPVPVVRVGSRYRVRVAELLRFIGADE